MGCSPRAIVDKRRDFWDSLRCRARSLSGAAGNHAWGERRRTATSHSPPEGPVAARCRGALGPGIQGVGPRRVRAGRAGDLGAAPPAPRRDLRGPVRPAAAARARDSEISLVERHRDGSTTGFTIDLVRLHDARRSRRRRSCPGSPTVDPARAPGLQRSHADDPPLRPAGARVGHGPPPRRPRRPARAARPARQSRPDIRRTRARPCLRGHPGTTPGVDVDTPSPTQVKILVPGNHLMVGLLGQRDELLRLVEDGVPRPRSSCAATRSPSPATSADAERVGRLFEEMVRAARTGSRPRPRRRRAARSRC